MSISVPRMSARTVVLAVVAGALLSLAFATTSFAYPAPGVACQNDGKISGRGSTLQTNLQKNLFEPGYSNDVCGLVNTADNSGYMVNYNYAGATNGSGGGQAAMGCRTDAFGGTDIPFSSAELFDLEGAPGTWGANDSGSNPNLCQNVVVAPPYGPAAASGTAPHLVYPNATDTTANLITVPVGESAVGLGIHFAASNTACATTSVSLTPTEVSGIFSGRYATWGDLPAGTGIPAGCTTPITRTVRSSLSGTTQSVKNYLKFIDPTTANCDASTWTTLQTVVNNTVWPSGGSCSALAIATSGGNMVSVVNGGDGYVGYADLADWRNNGFTGTLADLDLGTVAATVANSFTDPQTGTGSNCSLSVSLPAGTAGAVGLNTAHSGTTRTNVLYTQNWNVDANGASNHSNTAGKTGTGYPICSLTWDMAYQGEATGELNTGPVSLLNDDQRRTLATYFVYMVSPAAQALLSSGYYAPLPSTWLATLRAGLTAGTSSPTPGL